MWKQRLEWPLLRAVVPPEEAGRGRSEQKPIHKWLLHGMKSLLMGCYVAGKMTMTERKDALPRRMQDLPPAGTRLCMVVGRFLKEKCGIPSHHVIVAFLGGADSMALTVILRCLGISLVLVHFDHRLRPESGEEAESAWRFAERLGVPCMVRRVDVETLVCSERVGLKDAGRRTRYVFLDSALLSERTGWVVTGHHLDDLSEDVLVRLMCGSGWPGLGGMKVVDPARRLLRPLLGTPWVELEAFLCSPGVDWIEGVSNRSDAFRRNHMHNYVTPPLKAENPPLSHSTRTLWELACEGRHYWNEVLAPVFAQLRKENDSLLLPRAAFVSLLCVARLRAYADLLHRFGRGQAQSETLFHLDGAAVLSHSRKVFQFPGGVCITTDGDGVLMKTGGGGKNPF